MKKLFNKFNLSIISLVFALALCFGGIALFAPKQVDAAQYVAQIETKKYTTLQEAFDDVPVYAVTTIKLLANVDIDQPIEIEKTKIISLDLNNFNLTNENGKVFNVVGTLTLKGEGGTVFGAQTESEEATLDQLCVIFVDEGAEFEQAGGTISTVSGKFGYGITNYGTFSMYGGQISNNGKGIHNKGTINIYDGLITSNHYSGEGHGGGIENKNGTVTMIGGQISNNKATVGGGIYNTGGKVDINGGIISGNVATYDGGGIYNDSSLYVNGASIQNNKATSGAGIYNNDGEAQFSNAEIKDNVAQSSGGGVHNRGTASFTSCKITGNKATNGCGIYNRAAATGDTLSISTCEVSGNGAIQSNAVPWGSGIFNDSKTVVTINASEITNNGGDTSQNLHNRGNISAQETKIDGIVVNGSETNTTAQFEVTGNTNEIKHLQNYATVSISNCTVAGEFVNNSGTANFNTCTFTQITNSALTIKDGWAIVENSTVSGRIDVDDGYFNLTASHINLLNNSGTAIVVARSCTTVVNYGTLTYSGANPKTLMVASSSAQTTMNAFAEVFFFAQIATVDMSSQTLTGHFTVITGHGLALKDRQLFANYRGQ